MIRRHATASDRERGPAPSGVPVRGTVGRRRRHRAVTLLEVVLAMGVMALVMSMTYWFYFSALDTRSTVTLENRDVQLTRVIMDRMATELRQIAGEMAPGGVALVGGAEELHLYSLRVPDRKVSEQYLRADEQPPGEYDLLEVTYKIVRHPEVQTDEGWDYPLGLSRVEKLVDRVPGADGDDLFTDFTTGYEEDTGEDSGLEDLTGGLEDLEGDTGIELGIGGDLAEGDEEVDAAQTLEDIDWEELYCEEIVYLRFCYFDGLRWWDEWDISGDNPLPQIVQVTVGRIPRAPFGEDMGYDKEVEEFCTCQNEDTDDCEPLAADLTQITVRIPQADQFFRSRVARETQALIEEAAEAGLTDSGDDGSSGAGDGASGLGGGSGRVRGGGQ